MGHGITFLSNAVHDNLAERQFGQSVVSALVAFTMFDIRLMQTGVWIAETHANRPLKVSEAQYVY